MQTWTMRTILLYQSFSFSFFLPLFSPSFPSFFTHKRTRSNLKSCGYLNKPRIWLLTLHQSLQARNQDFFRVREFSWNQGTSINIHLQHQKEKSRRIKISRFFALETLKNFILNDKCYLKMTTIRSFFLQIRALFSNFQKGQGRPLPSPLQLSAWFTVPPTVKLCFNEIKLKFFEGSSYVLYLFETRLI